MEYNEPKVTIDLQEYLDLQKEAAKSKSGREFISIGDHIALQADGIPNADILIVQQVVHDGEYVSYNLKGRMQNFRMLIDRKS